MQSIELWFCIMSQRDAETSFKMRLGHLLHMRSQADGKLKIAYSISREKNKSLPQPNKCLLFVLIL